MHYLFNQVLCAPDCATNCPNMMNPDDLQHNQQQFFGHMPRIMPLFIQIYNIWMIGGTIGGKWQKNAADCAAICLDLSYLDHWRHKSSVAKLICCRLSKLIRTGRSAAKYSFLLFAAKHAANCPIYRYLDKKRHNLEQKTHFFPNFTIFTDPYGGKICRAARAAARYF